MAVSDSGVGRSHDGKVRLLCAFWQSGTPSSTSSSTQNLQFQSHKSQQNGVGSNPRSSKSVASVARSLLPARRRLRFDPANCLYFPYEPGKQAKSAVRIKNTSKSHVAFKFQTTAPKSCFMRPAGAVLAPGEILIATVFKFMELPENNEKPKVDQKSKVKYKILSMKVERGTEYIPEMFEEQKEHVTIERIMRAIFLDPERPSPALEKLKRQLAEAEAALEEIRKKAPADKGPQVVGEGLVIDEWKERREKYLAQQQGSAVNSL